MAVIKLKTFVANIANVLGIFDKMRFFRSESGELGPFVAITADSAEAATVTGSNAAPFSVNGLTLKLEIDWGAEQTVTFESANPVGIDLVVNEVNEQTTDLVASEDNGALVITSNSTGTASVVDITGGTALTELGLSVGDVNGKDADTILSAGVTEYEYDDQSGSETAYYQSQYINSVSGAVSSLSPAVQGSVSSVVPSANLITAKIDLANMDGTPMEDVVISLYNVYVPPLVISDIGVVGKHVEVSTDSIGHAEISLIKGAVVDVAIAGTELIRRITVPSSGTEFNLMDSIASADDLFQIQTPDIPDAVRRS